VILRSDRGQTAVEYMGLLLLVAAIVGLLLTTPIGAPIRQEVEAAICRITGGDCEAGAGAQQRADGRPPLSECVRTSSQRGVNGAVKVIVFKLGGGVEAMREERADGSVKVTLKANAKAGLDFGGPEAEVEGGGAEAGSGEREIEVTGAGEVAKAWTFRTPEEADAFQDDVSKKVKAHLSFAPNFPGTSDDEDIELPPAGETTIQGGVSVRGKAEAASGTGIEGNLGASVGATFNDDRSSPDFGDKTVYFEVAGSGTATAQAGVFDLGGSAGGKTRVGITYDRNGKEKAMTVNGQIDVTVTGELTRVADGADLKKLVANAQKASATGRDDAGGRLQVEAKLDLTVPENRDAARRLIDGRDPVTRAPVSRIDALGGLARRFESDATVNARAYALVKSQTGGELDLGVLGVEGNLTTEDTRLLDAYYRNLENGDFQRWEDCVRDLA